MRSASITKLSCQPWCERSVGGGDGASAPRGARQSTMASARSGADTIEGHDQRRTMKLGSDRLGLAAAPARLVATTAARSAAPGAAGPVRARPLDDDRRVGRSRARRRGRGLPPGADDVALHEPHVPRLALLVRLPAAAGDEDRGNSTTWGVSLDSRGAGDQSPSGGRLGRSGGDDPPRRAPYSVILHESGRYPGLVSAASVSTPPAGASGARVMSLPS